MLQVDPLARVEPGADPGGVRTVGGDGETARADVVAEQVVRLAVAAMEEGGDGGVVQGGAVGGSGHDVLSSVVSRSTAPSGIGSHEGRLRAS